MIRVSVTVLAVLLLCSAGLVAIWSSTPAPIDQRPSVSFLPDSAATAGLNYDTPMILPGITRPILESVDSVDLPDDSAIVGVVVVGQEPRAYVLEAMSGMSSHVVNDLIAETPVSVTYCDKADCARVFTSERRGEPIDLWLGGWMKQQMAVRLNERMYVQRSPEIPLDDLPFERTTWGDWKTRHSNTLVFTGKQGTISAEGQESSAARHPD